MKENVAISDEMLEAVGKIEKKDEIHLKNGKEQKELLTEICDLLNINDISLIKCKKCNHGSVILVIAVSVIALMLTRFALQTMFGLFEKTIRTT